MESALIVIFLVLVAAFLYMRVNALQGRIEAMESALRRRAWGEEPAAESQMRDLTYRKTFASF